VGSLVFLTTDILLFFLIALLAIYATYASRHEHLTRPWKQVLCKPLATASAVIMSFFFLIAILDSIHFHPAIESPVSDEVQYSVRVSSVLDLALGSIIAGTEKTYSAPFSVYAFTKETLVDEDGIRIRENPRLKHAGSHLLDPSSRSNDILTRGAFGITKGLISWIFFIVIIIILMARIRNLTISLVVSKIIFGKFPLPWRTFFLLLGMICVLVSLCLHYCPYYHVLGTDQVGNDILYQALKSARTGLLIGTLTTLVMLPFAIIFGVSAGYFGGWVDDLIQYVYTTLSSIPSVLLIAASALMLEVYLSKNADIFISVTARADLRLLCLCLILGVTTWTGLCRYLRAETLKLRESSYIDVSRGFGVAPGATIWKHVIPNVMHIVTISIVLDFSGLVLAEAALSYLNIGVDPSMESWGNMINGARLELAREPVVWWSLFAAFIFMFVLVLSANVFADAVRDAFDPHLRELS
jgi:peptide/nickel transport system permease protein